MHRQKKTLGSVGGGREVRGGGGGGGGGERSVASFAQTCQKSRRTGLILYAR